MHDLLAERGTYDCFRWFGPDDPVTLESIRQCDCRGVFTALHQFAYGEAWPREAIRQRRKAIEAHAMTWAAVESVPVSEDIKTRSGDFERHIENYKTTLRNLAAEGVRLVIYNFMPVLDWVRTDMNYALPDGRRSLRFDPVHWAAFDALLLGREGAEAEHGPVTIEKAREFLAGLTPERTRRFEREIADVFPGCKLGLSLDDFRQRLYRYRGFETERLAEHLKRFLDATVPVCEEEGVRLAIHADDPPFPVLGLPRIVSTEDHLRAILEMNASPANGICFCAGSLGARAGNDLPGMIERLGDRIHALHLRNTRREAGGVFYESGHLEGSTGMAAVVKAALTEMRRRREAGREDWRLPMRPDHGLVMLDDLEKPQLDTPGYHAIGRMKGLAEIRGLELGMLTMGV